MDDLTKSSAEATASETPNTDRLMTRLHRVVGPGLFLAAMAIGASHLVQSTRAGAEFGFQLVGLVIAVHLAKYSFFEYGHRYAAATGESLLHGYHRLGRGVLIAYLVLHTFTSVVGFAAVVFVTAASGLILSKHRSARVS